MGQKGTGRRLSDQERMEIIAKLEGDKPRASAAECARQYGVSSAAITKLMKMKDKIKQRFKENNAFSQQRKRGGTERHAAFEDELYQWISTQQQQYMHQQEQLQIELEHHKVDVLPPQQEEASGDKPTEVCPESTGDASTPAVAETLPHPPSGQLLQPLTSAKVQEKAQELLKAHNLGAFRASKGWYYRFCRRYGLSRTSLSADDGEHDDDDLGHSGSDSEGSNGDFSLDDGSVRQVGRKRKDGSSVRDGKRSRSQKGWGGVHALQDTLARAALALDHPEAREYLGEDAASEMLRSIQQSIGVVQCIRLKKSVVESASATETSSVVKAEDVIPASSLAPLATQSTEAPSASSPPGPVAESAPITDVIV